MKYDYKDRWNFVLLCYKHLEGIYRLKDILDNIDFFLENYDGELDFTATTYFTDHLKQRLYGIERLKNRKKN